MKVKSRIPVKRTPAKKVTAKKTPAKKTGIKKTPVKKSTVKKSAAKKSVVAKATPRKIVKSKKPVVVAAPVKTLVAPRTQTKTAERKAKRAAKAVASPVKKITPAAPQWPPLVSAVLMQLDDAKAEDVIAMDLSEKSTIADTMVVATGRSGRHVNAIADQVVEELSKHGLKNIRIEGVPQCDWVLVDAGDVIVHVFRPEVRSFYNLEKLWAANVPE